MQFNNVFSLINLKSLSFSSFEADSILAARRGKDILRRYYYFFTVAAQKAQGQGAAWNGWRDDVIRTFWRNPQSTFGSTSLRKTERAFPFEYDPANPTVSSPWHNILYETFYNSYLYGMRAISIHFPFGHVDLWDDIPRGSWPLTQFEWLYGTHVTGPYNSTTNPEFCQARAKGFTSAVRSLIEGNLKPVTSSRSGETGITEPVDVLLYLTSFGGWGGYRQITHKFWDLWPGSSAEKDAKLTEALDDYVDYLASMKSSNPNHGILSVVFDVGTHIAGPNSLHLHRSMPDYRSDTCELADHYVRQKLKVLGIPVAVEARAVVSRQTARATFYNNYYTQSPYNYPNPSFGTPGAESSTGLKNFSGDEHYLWYSDPARSNVFDGNNTYKEKYVQNGVGDWTHRLTGSTTTYHGAIPFGVTFIVSYGGVTYDIAELSNRPRSLVSGVYNPYRYLTYIYTGADVYIDYMYRVTGEPGWGNRRLLKNFSIFSIEPYSHLGSGLIQPGNAGSGSTYYVWWINGALPPTNSLFPLFNTDSPRGWTFMTPPYQLSNSLTWVGYTGGFWTTTSRAWFVNNIIPVGSTFGHLLNIFKDIATNYNPPGRTNPPEFASLPGFTQWGSTHDPYYSNIIDPIIRQ